MSASRGLRVAVAGATGALGTELLAVLDERQFPVSELLPIATERSAAEAVELHGEVFDVASGTSSLRGVDLVFLCAPPAASLELARIALRESVPCIDLSGALAGAGEIPLSAADLCPSALALRSPIVAAPAGPALAWWLVLAPLAHAAGLRRVVGAGLESVSAAGRLGIETLSGESIALFNQQDLPEPELFAQPVAFDCLPGLGDPEDDGETAHERALARDLRRVFGAALRLALTTVRVPTFSGSGATLAIETERPLSAADARALLGKAPGVELWEGPGPGPSLRVATGRDVVLVGRLRADPGVSHGLLLWLAADSVRLAAVNGVRLAEARIAAG